MESEATNPSLDLNEERAGAPIGKDPKRTGRDDKVSRMGTASIPRLIVEFAIPSILGMLVNGAYNVIDSVFLGQAMGEIGLATATVALPIMTVFMAIAMLVGNGGNALAALRMGEGNRVEAERSLGNTVCLSLVFAVIVAVLMHIPACVNALLGVSGATAEDWEYARSFIQIISLGFVFQCIGMGVNNFIRTAGAPNRALGTMIIGAVSCTVFNFLFVMVLGWGVQGSALATVCGQAISCATVLWYFIVTKNVPMKLHLHYLPLHLRTVRLILSLGLASFAVQAGHGRGELRAEQSAEHVRRHEPAGSRGGARVYRRGAARGHVRGAAADRRVHRHPTAAGFNYGAHLFERVKKTLWYGIFGATGIGLALWALVHLFPSRSSGSSASRTNHCATSRCSPSRCSCSCCPSSASRSWARITSRATGQPLKSIFLSLTRQILFLVPLLIVLPMVLPSWFPQFVSLDALYFATPAADFLAIFTTVVFIVLEMGRLKKLESGELKAKF